MNDNSEKIERLYDAIIKGRPQSELRAILKDHPQKSRDAIRSEVDALIQGNGNPSRETLAARNAIRLELVIGGAIEDRDFKIAIQAISELSKLKNLYQLSEAGNNTRDALALMTNEELDAAYRAEIEAEIERRGSRTIQ